MAKDFVWLVQIHEGGFGGHKMHLNKGSWLVYLYHTAKVPAASVPP